jgi:bifunctional DNA-binding transcriptional regulator/antitoxin component of YhaV-PrlF toxin-antitoxin module
VVLKLPHEETRKIIKVGETSFAVILPKSWLRYYGLTDKDQVIVISNGTVTIKPPHEKEAPQ